MPGMDEMGWKVVGGVAAMTAGLVARKAVQKAWSLGTGKEPPHNPADPDIGMAEAAGWALASGAVVGVARMLAERQAADRWRRSTGELPPGLRADET